jgi:hypothetical protein
MVVECELDQWKPQERLVLVSLAEMLRCLGTAGAVRSAHVEESSNCAATSQCA